MAIIIILLQWNDNDFYVTFIQLSSNAVLPKELAIVTLTTSTELVRLPFARNERLPAQPDVLWQIERSAVRCLTWNEAGLPVTLNYGGAADIVGTYLSAHRSYCIECLTRVEVTSLPKSRWQDAVEGIVAHARQTEELLVIVRNEPVQQRLQQLLVWLARKFGRSISLGELIDLRLIPITNNIALFWRSGPLGG